MPVHGAASAANGAATRTFTSVGTSTEVARLAWPSEKYSQLPHVYSCPEVVNAAVMFRPHDTWVRTTAGAQQTQAKQSRRQWAPICVHEQRQAGPSQASHGRHAAREQADMGAQT
jgi:hypothetical protein